MQGDQLDVLLIEDNAEEARQTRTALTGGEAVEYSIDEVATLAEASDRTQARHYDVVLLDLSLRASVGIDTVTQFCAGCPNSPPLIVLIDYDDQKAALEMLGNGVQDYVVKCVDCFDTLSHAIRNAMQRHQCFRQLHAANEMLKSKNQRLSKLYDTAQQFVDNVSHEFRTPLTVIREFTAIVRDGCDGPVTRKQIEHLDKVLNRTDDLALMVDDMLDISKLESGRLGVCRRPLQATEMIANVVAALKVRAESKGVRLTSHLDDNLPEVFCDEEKAQRVLINLTVNALKFTPEGGQVEIWARPAEDGAEITIGVTDTGPGISPENLAQIFRRFKQLETNLRASTKGFGLGLNIAKELVNLNLGQMYIESEVGEGSTFSFTLPSNNRAIVFERYAERIVSLTETLSELSFLSVSIDGSANQRDAQIVDDFLQHSVRSQDLVLQTSDQTWLVVAPCLECDVPATIDRLNEEWQGYVRNSPGGELHALQMAHRCTWPLSAGMDWLRKECAVLIDEGIASRPVRGTVLVVDDDREVSACLGVRLDAAGYKVLSAYDGEEGLAATIEHRPDAVVLDVRMPKIDGITMLSEIRANMALHNTPVVVLSANAREQRRALDAGANFFIAKPYEASEVMSAIQSSLNRKCVT